MVVLKIKFGDDVRRLSVQDATLAFGDLRALLRRLFAQSDLGEDFAVKYLDDEGDRVTITSDEELKEAFAFAQGAVLRLEIQASPAKEEGRPSWEERRERRRCRRAQQAREAAQQKREEPEQDDGSQVQHAAVCDNCNKGIAGIRFKCGNCPDYDLCEACEKNAPSVHDPQHVFLKLRSPIRYAARRCLLPDLNGPLPRFCVPPFGLHHPPPPPPPGIMPIAPPVITPLGGGDRQQQQPPFPGCRFRRWGGRGGRWQRLMRMQSRFIKDVTVEDGTVVPPGHSFAKVWSVNNCGSVAWPAGTRLVHISGDTLGPEPAVVVSESEVAPGETVEISVRMVAPQAEGRYVSNWRLCTPRRGFPFGQRVWADIIVKQGAEPPAAPAPVSQQQAEKAPEEKTSPLLKLRMVSVPPLSKAEEAEEEKKPEEKTSPLLKLRMVSPAPQAQPEKEERKPEGVAAAEKPRSPFEEGLEQLAAMGFVDKALNARILARRKGNVCAAVQDLLALQ